MPEEPRLSVKYYQGLTSEERGKRVIVLRELERGKSLEAISTELQVPMRVLKVWTRRIILKRPSRRKRA